MVGLPVQFKTESSMLDPQPNGIKRNKIGDLVAKSAFDMAFIKIPYTDLKPKINKFFHTRWQQYCNNNIHNILFLIKLTLVEWKPTFTKLRSHYINLLNIFS